MGSSGMRIALVMSHLDRSMAGAVRELHFCRFLQQLGAEVQVYRMHRGAAVEQESFMGGQVQVTFCPIDAAEAVPHNCVSTKLSELMNDFAPEVVLYKGLSYRINAFLQQRRPKGARFGFIVGGSVTDAILPEADFVFGEYEEQLERHFAPLREAGRAFVLPKYIDFELCRPNPSTPKDFDIVNVGNFYEKRKNQRDVLPYAAWYRIALVGGGKVPEELWAETPNLDNVQSLGRLQHSEVFGVLHRSRIMVHTSVMDGLPRALVEAMACGLPVIAYRSTVYGGFIQGRHGFRVDAETLPHAVHLLLKDDELYAEMSRNARQFVLDHHGPGAIRRMAKEFLALLQPAPAAPQD